MLVGTEDCVPVVFMCEYNGGNWRKPTCPT